MNGASPRQKVLLGVLGALALLLLLRYLVPSSPAPDAGSSRPSAMVDSEGDEVAPRRLPGARRPSKETVSEPLDLRLADLSVRPHSYTPGRDPFSFHLPPPGPSPEELAAARAQAEQERLAREAAERARIEAEARAQLPPPPPPPPQPPPFPYTYIGTIGPANHRIAIYSSDDKKQQKLAEEGEVIDGQFIVAHIGYESVEIKFVNFPNSPGKRQAIGRR